MKICVLGAGVIGVTTAYALARLGHKVSVIDQGNEVATGASHANGAQMSYSYVDPFASPAILKKLPGFLLGFDPAVRFGLSLRPEYLAWGVKFLMQCNSKSYSRNLVARSELAQLSRETLALYENELLPERLQRTGDGKMVIAQSAAELKNLKASAMDRLDQKILSPAQCLEIEPSLETWSQSIYGGLFSRGDHALDPVVYCKALQSAAVKKFGVRYFFSETIVQFRTKAGAVNEIATNANTHACDAVVVCLGNGTNEVLKSLGIKTSIFPMQGYSLTLPSIKSSPKTSITDMKNKIVYANLGDKIRVAGFMDANQSPTRAKARGEQLLQIAKENWPGAADYDGEVKHWSDYRPMMPSGVPLTGKTVIGGLYLNAGHGSLGYTFAAGSARKIAAEIGHSQSNTQNDKAEKNYAFQ